MLVFVIFFLAAAQHAAGLRCYVYDKEGAAIEEASDPNWNFCGYAPVFLERRLVDGRGWGIADRNDFTDTYKPFFTTSYEPIEVLSVCLIEKYDFSKFAAKAKTSNPEFIFRCVCNYDLCNKKETFSQYFV
ncbi:hypothetical protein AAVH_19012 [Aphelenchoides avenae]|nr:hypothetical protein AAVH_19012 [Aphelenchus avenae]